MISSRNTKSRSSANVRAASSARSDRARQPKRTSIRRADTSNALGIWAILISLISLAIVLNKSFNGATISPIGGKEPNVVVVLVIANQGWQDTGLEVHAGQQMLIEFLSGQVIDGKTNIIDGTGSDYVCGNSGCCEPLFDARRSSLIGRVGSTKKSIFYIGDGVEKKTDRAGNLFLRINDCNSGLADNYGAFKVRITIR